MKRRDFLTKGTAVAGLAGSAELLPPLVADQSAAAKPPAREEIRSAEYLQQVKQDKFLPKPPAFRESSGPIPISPMPLAERIRRNVVPRRGFCSVSPASDALLISGNGAMTVETACDPYSEQIVFRHESLFTPHRRPFEAPNIAGIFPRVRQMLLDGKYHDAARLGYEEWHKTTIVGGGFGGLGTGFSMHLEYPKTAAVKDYLRTVDFESTELQVHWTDEHGEWVRRTFASRPDNVVVQWLTAPKGQPLNVRISMQRSAGGGRGGRGGGLAAGRGRGGTQPAAAPPNAHQDFNEQRLIFKGIFDPSINNSGYAGVTRVVRTGGSARMDGDTLVIENASSVMLLTRIERLDNYSEDGVEAVRRAVDAITPDYAGLLERARKVQSAMLNRVTVDFGDAAKRAMSSEELLSDQRSSAGYSGAFLEKLFEMCRYWFILTSGKYCSMSAETNANINLQIAPGVQGDHREGMDAYFNWMESLYPDYRTNAKNIYGMRGAHYSLTPTKDEGVDKMYDFAGSTQETWPHPYWLSAGGWCVRPFWDHYLVTGDLDFLRNRVIPAYKDLALFYEDFLTVTDKNGNYIFVPSFSPENNPGNLDPSCMLVINSSMDIAVCREVLANLVQACELLGVEAGSVPKWKAMLAKLPPYLLEPDGAMKEWAWPSLAERYNQRHISHLYGAWPGDEIDPDRTPLLAKAVLIANRHRVPERLAAHGRCHRALVGARLKDSYMADTELRQLIEEGNVGPTLRCSHDPYVQPMPDAQGGIQLIIIEMLAYSRPGVIEVLPALPPSLVKGSMNGMLLRTFARLDKLAWDMNARTVDLTVTSIRKQDVTLIARHGIEAVSASPGALASKPQPGTAACDLHLPQGKPVEVHLKLGRRNPLDWVNSVA
ncbi:MAG TPA: glycoside hydrolase N-terminal domain-containing protein [Candidatus Limnocylindrales bacterium]|nr:glycoside hydrolase N-terminal domain-containing protein [Candidatus Limnocylindrales bacterium]